MVMTLASSAAIVTAMAMRGAQWGAIGGMGRRDNNNGVPTWLVVMVLSIFVYIASFLAIKLLSRYRELAADRAGAFLTGKPSALASALTKVSGDIAAIPQQDLRAAQSMNAFFIAPAVSGVSWRTVTSTHPSLEQRLTQLAEIGNHLGRPLDGGFPTGQGH
jgi:heat shock protein HtpX